MGRTTFNFDWVILIPALFLSSFGLIGIFSLTSELVFSQALFLVFGIICFFILSRIEFKVFEQYAPLLFFLSCIFLILPFFHPDIRGSSRWIFIGPFQMQPSELVKPIFLLFFAWFFKKFSAFRFTSLMTSFLCIIIPAGMVYLQPDLGNTLVYLFCFFAMIIGAGLPRRYIAGLVLLTLIFLPVSYSLLHQYQKNRITTFLSPEKDIMGAGYNAVQALIAVGSGQIMGRGLGRGIQSHLKFLPEYHTDFIFSSFVEEFGLVGGAVLLSSFFVLLFFILQSAQSNDTNGIGNLFAVGLFAELFIHVFINTGMNMGIVPITGITLPLVSYGGSSIIGVWMSLGILSSTRRIKDQSTLAIR